MITKLLGQFLITTVFLQFMPADASFFEYQVGEGDFQQAHLTLADSSGFTLGVTDQLESLNYPSKVNTDSYGVVTSAESVLVMDESSGMILLAEHPRDARPIGSVTKLMSALVFMDLDPDLTQIVALDPTLDLITGGRVYLAFYDGIELEDVLAASLVGSDNTATESLFRFAGVTKDEFVAKMNEKALELGMENSTFTDPTGIDSTNISTAEDLIKLLQAAEKNELIAQYMQSSSVVVNHVSGRAITIKNTNGVLNSYLNEGEYAVTAGKTGFLPLAGYVLATTIDHAGEKIHVVVMGSDSKDAREYDVRGLATWAYNTFSWPE